MTIKTMSKLTTFVTRGKIVESVHEAKCVVQNFNYKIILTTGHEWDLVYPRSAIKIFQAIPFIQSGAHKKYKLSKKEIIDILEKISEAAEMSFDVSPF